MKSVSTQPLAEPSHENDRRSRHGTSMAQTTVRCLADDGLAVENGAVDPPHRGKGIGFMLIAYAKSLALHVTAGRRFPAPVSVWGEGRGRSFRSGGGRPAAARTP